jgi:Fe-S oxidoreductase
MRLLLGRLLRFPLVMRLLGLEREIQTPASIALSQRVRLRMKTGLTASHGDVQRRVLLLVDPFVNNFDPEIGEAAFLVLQRLGYVPEFYFMDCSLRLLVSEGFFEETKNGLLRLRNDLNSREPMPIIGLEPAELLLFGDEAPLLLGDAWPTELMDRCFLLDEFLLHEHLASQLRSLNFSPIDRPVYFHPHCHERVKTKSLATVAVLDALFGLKAKIISTGCCGMGGRFGYCHSELSTKIFENNVSLPEEVESHAYLLVSGTSCRHQFRDLSDSKPLHLAQFLQSILVDT